MMTDNVSEYPKMHEFSSSAIIWYLWPEKKTAYGRHSNKANLSASANPWQGLQRKENLDFCFHNDQGKSEH